MQDFWLNLGITAVLTGIKESFKNPEKKASLKATFLKVRNAINQLYADDRDFA